MIKLAHQDIKFGAKHEFVPVDWEIHRANELPDGAYFASLDDIILAIKLKRHTPVVHKFSSLMTTAQLFSWGIEVKPTPPPLYEAGKFSYKVGAYTITPEQIYGVTSEEILAAATKHKVRVVGFGDVFQDRVFLSIDLGWVLKSTQDWQIKCSEGALVFEPRLIVEYIKETKNASE